MIPKNSIVIKSTPGGEYVNIKTNAPYKGYYYEYKNKIYAGREFTISGSIELVPVGEANKLLGNSSTTNIYSSITGITSQTLSSPVINTIIINGEGTHMDPYILPFFYFKKYNDNIIKKIDEETYLSLQNNPIYQTTYTGQYGNTFQTVEDADKQLPGIKIFLSDILDEEDNRE